MENRLIKVYFTLMLVALLGLPALCFGQKSSKTYDLEINVGYNDVQDFTMNYNASVSHWLKLNRFAITTGLGISYTYHDLNTVAKIKGKTYSIDNNNIFQITGIVGVEYLQPVIKNSGLLFNCSFLFEPIPFNKTSFDVWDNGTGTAHKSKWVFTRFNPGFILKAGYYFDTTIFGSPVRVGVGGGVSWQDGLKAYRLVKIDGTRFGSQMEKNKISYLGFIKVTTFF